MHQIWIKISTICLATLTSSVLALAQQSTPLLQKPDSLAPLSSSTPKLGKFTAAPKGSELVFSHSTVRLIPGEYKDGKWTAGVEMEMTPGWKTYWRVPGDAGVPAEFVWKKSSNVKSVKVSWPAPKRYEDITGKSIGYKKHVVFPVKVTPVKSGAPAELDLQLYYAICSDICVPAQANLKLTLPIGLQNTPAAQRISDFAAIVPNGTEQGVSVRETSAMLVDGKPVLSVKLAGKLAAKTDILVEGFEAAFFNVPDPMPRANGSQIFYLPIDGIEKPEELSGKSLKLTVLSGDIRFETNVKVR